MLKTHRTLYLFVACLAVLSGLASILAQAPRGTGMISGVVVDAVTGQPLAGSVVHVGGGAATSVVERRQLTDSQGRFALADLPPLTRVTLTASYPGYLNGGFDSQGSPGSMNASLSLADEHWLRDVRIPLWRPSSISGTVMDETGEPMVGVTVIPLGLVHIAGHDHFTTGSFTTTDDQGRYRLAGLVPGRYAVAVPSSRTTTSDAATLFPIPPPPLAGQTRSYPLTFAPGATTITNATSIELERAVDRAGVDVQVVPVPSASIEGRLGGPGTEAGRALRLLPAGLEALGLGVAVQIARVAADGTFRFDDVPAGNYVVDAPLGGAGFWVGASTDMARYLQPAGAWHASMQRFSTTPVAGDGVRLRSSRADGDPATWAREPVSVGAQDVTGVVVTLQPAASVRGHVVFETAQEEMLDPQSASTILFAEPAAGDTDFGLPEGRTDRSDPERPFTIDGLGPTDYLLQTLSGRWLMKSVVFEGRDVTYTPLDASSKALFDDVIVTVSDQPATLTGAVRDGLSAPMSGAEVVIFPADPVRWSNYGLTPSGIKAAHSSPSGEFSLSGLPGGEYLVVALAPESADWQRAGFFADMAALAERVTLEWGVSTTVNLQPVRQ